MKKWIRRAKTIYWVTYLGYPFVMYLFLGQVTNLIVSHYPTWGPRVWVGFCLLMWHLMEVGLPDFREKLKEDKKRIKELEDEFNNV